jgi:hypothetical protein
MVAQDSCFVRLYRTNVLIEVGRLKIELCYSEFMNGNGAPNSDPNPEYVKVIFARMKRWW